ncbi:unnamed protein product [Caenorhabditis auriculariae]|uniref:Uncharacterized protein n=1 Tax=Caenorhabditis auriculariae TaxID=2777116 RepID=A0A8S1GX69_9PELO|nr:unnamed protein product [Caenorhabditis auriculariae]
MILALLKEEALHAFNEQNEDFSNILLGSNLAVSTGFSTPDVPIHCTVLVANFYKHVILESWAQSCSSVNFEQVNLIRDEKEVLKVRVSASVFRRAARQKGWHVFAVESTFVVLENLQLHLLPFQKHNQEARTLPFDFVASQKAVERMAEGCVKYLAEAHDDLPHLQQSLLKCVNHLGIEISDTRDSSKRHKITSAPRRLFDSNSFRQKSSLDSGVLSPYAFMFLGAERDSDLRVFNYYVRHVASSLCVNMKNKLQMTPCRREGVESPAIQESTDYSQ